MAGWNGARAYVVRSVVLRTQRNGRSAKAWLAERPQKCAVNWGCYSTPPLRAPFEHPKQRAGKALRELAGLDR